MEGAEIAATVITLAVTLSVGLLLLGLGFLLLKKQKIGLMHEYHRKNVKPGDVGAYTRLWGIGLLILGGCTCLTGITHWLFRTYLGWIFFAIGFILCLFFGNRAQKIYNGGWFG